MDGKFNSFNALIVFQKQCKSDYITINKFIDCSNLTTVFCFAMVVGKVKVCLCDLLTEKMAHKENRTKV